MFGAIANKHSLEAMVTPSVLEDMVWNLQTWPLDLVDWPTHNSHRLVRVHRLLLPNQRRCSPPCAVLVTLPSHAGPSR